MPKMRFTSPYILGIWLITSILSANALAEVKLVLDQPKNGLEEKIFKRLENSPTIKSAISFLNDTFITPNDVYLTFGDYERTWYQNNKIEIPYRFINNIRINYSDTRFHHKRASLDEFTGNTLFHVIFHEFAHALIEQYRIPVLGKEEDAADNLADVLLIHFFNNGDKVVIGAADLFYINSIIHNRRLKKEDYWSEHSLNKQRYYARVCHAYGSNPTEHIALKNRAGFSDQRADRCIFQYREVEDSWLTILTPAFKNSPQNEPESLPQHSE